MPNTHEQERRRARTLREKTKREALQAQGIATYDPAARKANYAREKELRAARGLTHADKYSEADKQKKRARYLENKALLASLRVEMGGVCVECGHKGRLEFDHVDPKTKLFPLARACLRSEEAIRAEAAKCRLLCRKCHWKNTSEQHANETIKHPRRTEPSTGILKRCSDCKTEKDLADFYKSEHEAHGRKSICRICDNGRAKNRFAKGKLYIESKKTSCVECGATEGLEFDHVRGEKSIEVSSMSGHALAAIDVEIAKCDVVCVDCHMARTEARGQLRGRPSAKRVAT